MTTTGDVRQASLRPEELLPGILGSGAARGRPVPRAQPARGPAAGVRRSGGRPGARRRGPHRARRTGRALAARLLPPARATPPPPSSTPVDRIRDGRSFTTRRVVATQHGKAIFTLSASFHVVRGRRRAPVRDARRHPNPTTVPLWQDRLREFGDQVPARWLRPRPSRCATRRPALGRARSGQRRRRRGTMVWMRAVGTLPDDPLAARLRRGLRQRHDAARLGAGRPAAGVGATGHASPGPAWITPCGSMRPFRADDWLLYVQEAPVTVDGPGPRPRPHLPRRTGGLAVSVVQEGLIRVTVRGTRADDRRADEGPRRGGRGRRRARPRR